MKATTEVEIKVGGRLLGFTEICEGTYRFVIETEILDKEEKVKIDTQDNEQEIATDVQEDVFILVEASKLNLDDEFMKYEPTNEREEIFKEGLTKVIQKGINDFYRPKHDPSFNGDGTGVIFKAGEKPAVNKSYKWWENVAKKFMPNRHSRLGTMSEYVAFLGVLIKKLIEDEKWSIAKAWDAVCNNSKELGHYRSLLKTLKILAEDKDDRTGGFWLVGGLCDYYAFDSPFATFNRSYVDWGIGLGVGWVVIS